jgi:hypothetical protein
MGKPMVCSTYILGPPYPRSHCGPIDRWSLLACPRRRKTESYWDRRDVNPRCAFLAQNSKPRDRRSCFFSCFFCVFFFGMESHGIPNRKNLSPSHEDGIVAESTIPWKSDCPSWICADDLSILDLHFFWGFVYPSGARWPFRGDIGTWEPRSDLITLLHT